VPYSLDSVRVHLAQHRTASSLVLVLSVPAAAQL
jgi:hypothetical protein